MTQPTGSQRKLPYPLRDTLDLESVVGSGGVPVLSLDGWSTEDTEERVDIILNISLDEYVAIASALDVGRDIAYGDNSIYLWWVWVRSLLSMNPCQFVLDCINDTPEIQQAIATYSNSSSITGTTPEQQGILDTDVFGSQSPCDNDEIYGMTLQMTDLLNEISVDILELFVTAFSTPGRIGDIIEAIPGLGILPFDDMFQMIEKMAVQVFGAYEAAYDTQVREDISCDLFCIAQATCTLTLEDARDYFQSKVVASLDNTDFLHVIEDILVNNWIGEQGIFMMHWFILDTIIFGGETLGIDTARIVTTIATYFNDPNPDWSTLCTCVEPWESILDFTTSDLMDIAAGVWVDGVGYQTTFTGGDRKISLSIDFDDSTLTYIEWVADVDIVTAFGSGGTEVADKLLRIGGANIVPAQFIINYSSVGLDPFDLSNTVQGFEETADQSTLFIRASHTTNDGQATIEKLVLKGIGLKPSQLP